MRLAFSVALFLWPSIVPALNAPEAKTKLEFTLLGSQAAAPRDGVPILIRVKNIGKSPVYLARAGRQPIVWGYFHERADRVPSQKLEDVKSVVFVSGHGLYEGQKHCLEAADIFALEPGNSVLLPEEIRLHNLGDGVHRITANLALLHLVDGQRCGTIQYVRGDAEATVKVQAERATIVPHRKNSPAM